LIIGDAIGLELGRSQPLGHVHRSDFQSQLQGCLIARVAHDNDAVLVDHNGLAKAELLD
jgi:hypothetical protein